MLTKFFDAAEKIDVKVGVLSNQKLEKNDVSALSKLPSLESLRSQLLGLLAQPAQQMVFILNAVPQNVLNVLQAKVDAEGGN